MPRFSCAVCAVRRPGESTTCHGTASKVYEGERGQILALVRSAHPLLGARALDAPFRGRERGEQPEEPPHRDVHGQTRKSDGRIRAVDVPWKIIFGAR